MILPPADPSTADPSTADRSTADPLVQIRPTPLRKTIGSLFWAGLAGMALLIALVLWLVLGARASWHEVARVDIMTLPEANLEVEPATAANGPATPAGSVVSTTSVEVGVSADPRPDLDTFLLVGSDSRDGLSDLGDFGDFEGARADVVMLMINPGSGRSSGLLSLPRDLWVETACQPMKLGETLGGCGSYANGPTLLASTVAELTGLGVDHLVMVDLAGFQQLVDLLGGHEICLANPVRDSFSGLDLPAGCTLADGSQTLGWLRSRETEELVDGSWRPVAEVTDLERNHRQLEFMLTTLDRLGSTESFGRFRELSGTVAGLLTVDSGLDLGEAMAAGWSLREMADRVRPITIPVHFDQATGGASILIADGEIADTLERAFPPG